MGGLATSPRKSNSLLTPSIPFIPNFKFTIECPDSLTKKATGSVTRSHPSQSYMLLPGSSSGSRKESTSKAPMSSKEIFCYCLWRETRSQEETDWQLLTKTKFTGGKNSMISSALIYSTKRRSMRRISTVKAFSDSKSKNKLMMAPKN